MSNADELKKLKELLDSGVLSKEEFEIEKSKIISTKESSSIYENNLGKSKKLKKTIVYASIALVVIMIGVFYFVNTNNNFFSYIYYCLLYSWFWSDIMTICINFN